MFSADIFFKIFLSKKPLIFCVISFPKYSVLIFSLSNFSRDRWTEIWLTKPCGYIEIVSTGSTNTISPSFRLKVSFLYSSSIFPEYCKIKKQNRLFTRSISSAFRTILLALFLIKAISVSPNKKH
ncbi:Uncharacterised protein [Acinetobacter baumannii]|nr:Uncharacterised protein [Acinetobacter baumannii]